MDSPGHRATELIQPGLFDRSPPSGEHDVLVLLKLGDRQHGGHFLTAGEVDQVDDGLALAAAAHIRDLVDLEPVDLPLIGEDQQIAVGRSHKKGLDKILLPGAHPDTALAAAVLHAIDADGGSLQIPRMGHGDHHVLDGDQVLQRNLGSLVHDGRATLVPVLLADRLEFLHQELLEGRVAGKDLPELGDLPGKFGVFLIQLFPLQAGEGPQLHIQNVASLDGGEREFSHQAVPSFLGRPGPANDPDHPVDMVQRLEEALQDVGPFLGLFQLVAAATPDHLAAVVHEAPQGIHQVQDSRLAVGDRQHDHAEAALHGRELVEVVQDDFRLFAAPQLHHDAHAVTVRLVAQVGDAVDSLGLDQVRDLFDQLGLVDLKRNFRDHDHGTIAAGLLFDGGLGPDDDRAPTRRVGLGDSFPPVDHPPGREVRARHDLGQFLQRGVGFLHQADHRVGHLGQVVGGDIGGHSHRDAGRTIYQQIGNPGRQAGGLELALIVVGDKVHRVHFDVGQHLPGNAGQPGFGVAHGRGRISVHRSEVALAVHQRVAHGEVLRHAHLGVIDGVIAMRVKVAHDLPDDLGALAIGLVGRQPHLPHAVQDPAMDRLESIPNVGKGTPDDHAHGIVQVGAPHLLFNVDRHLIEGY